MALNFSYQLVNDDSITTVVVTPHPDWDEFDQFVDIFVKNEQANIIDRDLGMDRHQVRYRKGQEQYILQFEHYTNSIWIERDY